MLFNSYEFIFLFLPITLLGFHLIGKQGKHRIAIAWLVGASLFFYGWWNPAYLGLILFSILFNYSVGISLNNTSNHNLSKKTILAVGVSTNLTVLGYYKYANFFIDNLNALSGTNLILYEVILPLAISFFTFQQIAYLVDAYRGETKEYSFLHYCLFVTFFPQLIAGPIVHHKEMLPQFSKDSIYRLRSEHLAVGITIFILGLFKKVVMADSFSVHATPLFNAAEIGTVLTFYEAWIGSIAYSLQLYFDFSGYSDMAIGIARMFGIRLPLNFNSPYKATSIIDFWRRWHITLSRFLRDYLYIPFGGSRKGKFRRYLNLMITMLLGGLWHGAGWGFVLWGGLHGLFLIINHAWRGFKKSTGLPGFDIFGYSLALFITLTSVVIAWVPFRAHTIEGAISILSAMLGMNGLGDPHDLKNFIGAVFLLIITALIFPNTQQIMRSYRPFNNSKMDTIGKPILSWLKWRANKSWAFFICTIFIVCIANMTKVSEFLYFNF